MQTTKTNKQTSKLVPASILIRPSLSACVLYEWVPAWKDRRSTYQPNGQKTS